MSSRATSGAAIANAQWSFLRDRFDVNALVAHISETAQRSDFVSKLHAAADKARHQQIPGRPKTRRPKSAKRRKPERPIRWRR
jgi:hypothetical protein